MKLQVESLFPFFDNMQVRHGEKSLNAIYGAGCIKSPDLWKVIFKIGRLSKDTFLKTQEMKVDEWTEKFCRQIYSEIGRNRVYITNLSKSTQLDARHLPDKHYRKYLELLKKEIEIIKPRKIIFFW